nr:Arc family DNA-binding protein [Cronobacter turicensis]TWR31832.1 Arc family DNA-binding protein [Cronobacter turicensis]
MAERKYKHPQVNLRLPEDLKNRIAELAESNGRSANAEMVAAIEAWVKKSAKQEPVKVDVEELTRKVEKLESVVMQVIQEAKYPSPSSLIEDKEKKQE